MLSTTRLSYSSNIMDTKVIWLGWSSRLDRLVQRCYNLTGLMPPDANWLVEDILTAFNTERKPVLSDRTVWQLEMASDSPLFSLNGYSEGAGLYVSSVLEDLMEEELVYLRRVLIMEPGLSRLEIFRWAGMEPLLRLHKCVKEPYYHSNRTVISLR